MCAAIRLLVLALLLTALAGCTPRLAPTAPSPAGGAAGGVTANSGGDTRGTVSYRPGPVPVHPPDPYSVISSTLTLPQRQKYARMLAEIDIHAHQQAANAFPVPEAGSLGYSKSSARDTAERQATFNAYLLEKYHARFCNQFHVTYDQLALLREEGRDKNWPMPKE